MTRLTRLLTTLSNLNPGTRDHHPGIGQGMLAHLIEEGTALLAESLPASVTPRTFPYGVLHADGQPEPFKDIYGYMAYVAQWIEDNAPAGCLGTCEWYDKCLPSYALKARTPVDDLPPNWPEMEPIVIVHTGVESCILTLCLMGGHIGSSPRLIPVWSAKTFDTDALQKLASFLTAAAQHLPFHG